MNLRPRRRSSTGGTAAAKITILQQADLVHALGSTAVLACPMLPTGTPSLEKSRL